MRSEKLIRFSYIYVVLIPLTFFLLTFVPFSAHGHDTGQGFPKTVEIGQHTVTFPGHGCNDPVYHDLVFVDAIQEKGTNTWTVVCAPNSQESRFTFLTLESFLDEKLRDSGNGADEVSSVNGPDAPQKETTEEGVETGSFFGWIQDSFSGVKKFISGEITCKDAALKKQPQKGIVTSVDGEVFIARGIKVVPGHTGTPVFGGDVITVQEGSKASLDLTMSGSDILNIPEKSKFQIPRQKLPCARQNTVSTISVTFGGLWLKAKEFLKGESYEIHTPTDSGRRG